MEPATSSAGGQSLSPNGTFPSDWCQLFPRYFPSFHLRLNPVASMFRYFRKYDVDAAVSVPITERIYAEAPAYEDVAEQLGM